MEEIDTTRDNDFPASWMESLRVMSSAGARVLNRCRAEAWPGTCTPIKILLDGARSTELGATAMDVMALFLITH